MFSTEKVREFIGTAKKPVSITEIINETGASFNETRIPEMVRNGVLLEFWKLEKKPSLPIGISDMVRGDLQKILPYLEKQTTPVRLEKITVDCGFNLSHDKGVHYALSQVKEATQYFALAPANDCNLCHNLLNCKKLKQKLDPRCNGFILKFV
jgi:hypothetical protein